MGTRRSVGVVAAGLVLAVAGCGGGTGEKTGASGTGKGTDKPAPAQPSRELVRWVGTLCESTAALENIRKDSAADLKEIRNPDEYGPSAVHLAVGYIAKTPMPVEGVERDLKDLDPSGVPAADRLLDAWLKKLGAAVTGLDKASPSAAFDDPEGSAADVDELVQSLTPPEPDLPGLTKKDPRLAAAHHRAEQCAPGWQPAEETASPTPDPDGPLPEAADGKDTGACSDGECEVLVTSSADVTANGLNVHVTANGDVVTFRTPNTVMQLGGQGGVAEFGDALKATVVAQNEDGAVLRFTTP